MGGTAPLRFHSVTKHSLRKDVQQPAKLSKRQLDARRRAESSARNSIKVEPAQPGQSYRPDEEQHQDVIGEALSIELRRKEALDYRNAPVGGGKMSEETLALLVGSSDEESSDDEDDDVEMTNVRHKRKEKLTRAQRNKQKRVKAEAFLLQEKRSKKKHLSQFDYSKTVHKELRKESTAQIARREEINALKAEMQTSFDSKFEELKGQMQTEYTEKLNTQIGEITKQMEEIKKVVGGSKRYVLQAFIPRDELPDEAYRTIPRTTAARLKELQSRMAGSAEEILLRGA